MVVSEEPTQRSEKLSKKRRDAGRTGPSMGEETCVGRRRGTGSRGSGTTIGQCFGLAEAEHGPGTESFSQGRAGKGQQAPSGGRGAHRATARRALARGSCCPFPASVRPPAGNVRFLHAPPPPHPHSSQPHQRPGFRPHPDGTSTVGSPLN